MAFSMQLPTESNPIALLGLFNQPGIGARIHHLHCWHISHETYLMKE